MEVVKLKELGNTSVAKKLISMPLKTFKKLFNTEKPTAEYKKMQETCKQIVQGNGIVERSFTWVNNCLLYTSPSPRDRQKSRMPSSA